MYLMRSAPYEYLVPGMNLYESFNVVGKGDYEVEISEKEATIFVEKLSDELKCKTVFTSPRVRSQQTGKLLTSQPIVVEDLREVLYNMDEFISEDDFFDTNGKPNVTKARKAFVKTLINDDLTEKFGSVIERIESLIKKVIDTDAEIIVMVSHGFFMKIFEAYVIDPSIKYEPNRLLKYFSGASETFAFGEKAKFMQEGNSVLIANVEN